MSHFLLRKYSRFVISLIDRVVSTASNRSKTLFRGEFLQIHYPPKGIEKLRSHTFLLTPIQILIRGYPAMSKTSNIIPTVHLRCSSADQQQFLSPHVSRSLKQLQKPSYRTTHHCGLTLTPKHAIYLLGSLSLLALTWGIQIHLYFFGQYIS